MNLLELKSFVDRAIENAGEHGEDPSEITVSVQIDNMESETIWSDDIELIYDGDGQASGCVLRGWKEGGVDRNLLGDGIVAYLDELKYEMGLIDVNEVRDRLGAILAQLKTEE